MNFEDRAGIEIFKFERDGATLAGVFVGMETVNVNNKQTPAFHVAEVADDFKRLTGREYQFLQSADLRSKIRPTDRGKVILVKRDGQKDTPNGKMTIFQVKVSKDRFPTPSTQANPEITDADIPF